MELAFLSRRDMQASPWDPLTKTSASLCSNNLPSPGLFLNKSTKPSPASTPLQSPTSSPTSPNSKMVSPFLSSSAGGAALNASMNSSSSDSSFHAQGDSKAGGHSVSKSKSKRKKKVSHINQENSAIWLSRIARVVGSNPARVTCLWYFFTGLGESTEYTMLTHIGVWVKKQN